MKGTYKFSFNENASKSVYFGELLRIEIVSIVSYEKIGNCNLWNKSASPWLREMWWDCITYSFGCQTMRMYLKHIICNGNKIGIQWIFIKGGKTKYSISLSQNHIFSLGRIQVQPNDLKTFLCNLLLWE